MHRIGQTFRYEDNWSPGGSLRVRKLGCDASNGSPGYDLVSGRIWRDSGETRRKRARVVSPGL